MKLFKPIICLLGTFVLVTTVGMAYAGRFPEKDGYLIDERGHVVRNGTGGCWHTRYWKPELAIEECDPGLAPKETPAETKPVSAAPPIPSPSPVVAPEPTPLAAPEKPAVEASFSAETLFDFDKAVVKPAGRKILEEKIVTGVKSHPEVGFLMVTGHADRIGTEEYNQKLSERRANAVKDYLVKQGVDAERIKVEGKGESEPDPEANTEQVCKGLRGGKLIACLQPDRRVTIVSQRRGADH
ncbi:MAG: OmpA family protein [Gallionellaceae bacterium]